MILLDTERAMNHFHVCHGRGGGARGFNRSTARLAHLTVKGKCIGGVDFDPRAVRDFERIAGVSGTVLDLFTRDQYVAFHGHQPPDGWCEATPDDFRRAAGGRHPHVVFMSTPCKGFSGLLSETSSKKPKYQALNGLTLRAVWLTLEAWKDDPVELVFFENVPRIRTRGRWLLDQINALLRAYGYISHETEHDCGEIGGLAQHRRRFLLVARHAAKVPAFMYEPPRRTVRGVGEVLDRLPMPLSGLGGPMHRVPSLQWQTWMRLALVEAGSDWRSLNRLRVEGGKLADYVLVPEAAWHNGALGVTAWTDPSGVVTSGARPGQGTFSVADPRVEGHPRSVQLGVRAWDQVAPTVTGQMWPGQGPFTVADPRFGGKRFNHVYRIVKWDEASVAVTSANAGTAAAVADPRTGWPDSSHRSKLAVGEWNEPAGTVTGTQHVTGGALCVADPRAGTDWNGASKYHVTPFDKPANTVIASSTTGSGAFAVADPRPESFKGGRDVYITGGHYGVVPWDAPSGAVTGSGQHDNGRWSVADPRELPAPKEQLIAIIRSLDGTWHRPFTTLELAALQALFDIDDFAEFRLDGDSDAVWREGIGNAVPGDAGEAMGNVAAEVLAAVWTGEQFRLSDTSIWVRQQAIALAVDVPELPA